MASADTHFRVAIIGAGFSGLGMAVRLKQEGIESFVVLERFDGVGGTWRANHYPGCCCDVPSHVYSYSFALRSDWNRGFASQPEILDYLREVAAEHELDAHIRLGHEVTEAVWDNARRHWRIATSRGSVTADVLVNAGGALSEPRAPELPGVETFAGTSWHSARWNHDHDLAGERVAVIGTGASAIQFVPAIQPKVAKLHVFQRTPPWIIPRWDHQITKLEKALLRAVPFAPMLVRGVLYWTLEARVIGFRNPKVMKIADRVARRHLRRQVKNQDLRAKLMPGYVMGCKRVLISDDYYPSLGEPNVDLLTDGIAEIRPHSIITQDGTEHEIDTLIFGTGFEVTRPPIATRIRGTDGRTLDQHWQPSMYAYKGTFVPGFPNFAIMTGPNTGLGHNSMVFMIESQLNYVLGALRHLDDNGARVLEVRRDAVQRYNDRLERRMEGTVWTAGSCNSWYLDETGRNTTLWPGYSWAFRAQTRRFDAEAYEFAG